MIVSSYNSFEGDEDEIVFITNGCGCCSSTLFLSTDKDEIIMELKRNIEIVRNACDQIGISFEDLL